MVSNRKFRTVNRTVQRVVFDTVAYVTSCTELRPSGPPIS